MIRAILDTNVLINGVQDEYSYTYKIIAAAIAGEVQALASPKIVKEYQLLARRLVTDAEYLNLLDDFYQAIELVHPKHYNDIVTADPEDNKFIDAAEAGSAEFIITEDAHLLDIEQFDGTRIVEPSDFWAIYQGKLSEDDEGQDEWNSWAGSIGIG